MKSTSFLLLFLTAALVGTTFSSCSEDDCEPCIQIPTDIKAYEKTIVIRFSVPETVANASVTFGGTLIWYNEVDPDGVPVDVGWSSKAFKTESGVEGHSSDITATGEPVPGAEIIIEQEPYDDPVASSTTDGEGSLLIDLKNLAPGTYQIRVTASPSNTSKGGFAIGGFYAS